MNMGLPFHAETLLRERSEALTDAVMPKHWHQRPLRMVELECGCVSTEHWESDGERQWKERQWAEQCDLHEAAERISKGRM
jgi:hypothetical protein